ncbi:hypothetical protein ACN28S_67725 [Cystobacter fuscus]
MSRNFKQKTVRVYADEALLITKLCEALSTPDTKVEISTLLVTAAVEEATLWASPPPCRRGTQPPPTARPTGSTTPRSARTTPTGSSCP